MDFSGEAADGFVRRLAPVVERLTRYFKELLNKFHFYNYVLLGFI